MSLLLIKSLSRERFNAFVDWTRYPAAGMMSSELEWYSDGAEHVLGVLLRDHIDNDYVFIVLGRDETLRFRCIDTGASYTNIEAARVALQVALGKHSESGQAIFPQGEPHKGIDLFTPIVPREKCSPDFDRVISFPQYSSAVGIMTEMMRHYPDIDGNFVEQFQTTGFDARIWELYIYAYLKEEQLFFDRDYRAPDYVVKKYGHTVCIEAVTVNPTAGNVNADTPLKINLPKTPEELRELLDNYMPIKFGGSLYSKINRKKPYWELPHVSGHPLIFAIADFHESGSMIWSSNALLEYLYGVRHEFFIDENGQLVISPLKIEKHELHGKQIPSGFFFQPKSEYVSAVLFSNSGTISKFCRMGRLAGFGDDNVKISRIGFCHDHDPNATLPNKFILEIEPGKVKESWAEGLSMFHNPNALHPVPHELFPSIAHHEFRDGLIYSDLPKFYPYWSITMLKRKVDN